MHRDATSITITHASNPFDSTIATDLDTLREGSKIRRWHGRSARVQPQKSVSKWPATANARDGSYSQCMCFNDIGNGESSKRIGAVCIEFSLVPRSFLFATPK